jgi:hypothetical protein
MFAAMFTATETMKEVIYIFAKVDKLFIMLYSTYRQNCSFYEVVVVEQESFEE